MIENPISPERLKGLSDRYPRPWSYREGFRRSLVVGHYEGPVFTIYDATGQLLFDIEGSAGGSLADLILSLVNDTSQT